MIRHAPFPGFRRFATIAIVFLLVPSCRSWQDWDGPAATAMADKPDRIRVTLTDGRRFTLVTPVLQGDSLVGSALFGPLGVPGGRSAMAMADIRNVEIHRISGGKTAFAVGGGVAVLLVVAAAVAAAGEDPAPQPTGTGSCPLVYSWDGERWRLDSGTYGGAITEALARTDVDNLDYLTASPDGIVRLKIANELPETDYIDALRLLAVDHERGVIVAPSSEGELQAMGTALPPAAARGLDGRDALARLAARDDWGWESSLVRSAAGGSLRDGVELEFPRPADAIQARLLVDGHNTPWATHLLQEYLQAHGDGLDAWYASLDGHPPRARRFFDRLARQAFLDVAVLTEDGWRSQALVWEAGPEIVKRQVVALDLSHVRGDIVRVRLSAPTSFWLVDHAAIDYGPAPAFVVHEVDFATARGTDGSDIRHSLSGKDGQYWVARQGDSAEVTFRVPPVVPGHTRTYLLASTGWYRMNASRSGPPDSEMLTRMEEEPDAIARIAFERREAALTGLAGIRDRAAR